MPFDNRELMVGGNQYKNINELHSWSIFFIYYDEKDGQKPLFE